jgi:hypothetical protein
MRFHLSLPLTRCSPQYSRHCPLTGVCFGEGRTSACALAQRGKTRSASKEPITAIPFCCT